MQYIRAGVITDFILNVNYSHWIMAAWTSVWEVLNPNLDSVAQDHDQERILYEYWMGVGETDVRCFPLWLRRVVSTPYTLDLYKSLHKPPYWSSMVCIEMFRRKFRLF